MPLPFINMLICSALARAQKLYPVKIICFVVQANHVHMLIRVCDPQIVSRFIGYFKAESANYLNRLLNRRQRTVWEERFDSPIVLDLDKALQIFAYCSLNPVKDGLVNSMSEYPGVASYSHLLERRNFIPAKSIPRSKVPSLKDPHRPQRENNRLTEHFSSDAFKDAGIALYPEELRVAYPSSRGMAVEEFRATLIHTLQKYEEAYRTERSTNAAPMGATRLVSGSLLSPRNPPTKGRKMVCLSTIKELRQSFISSFKRLKNLCREVFEQWRKGDTLVPYPPGMFAPQVPRRANFLPSATF